MTETPGDRSAKRPESGGVGRLAPAWRALAPEQRLVLAAAAVLLASMLLPWYSRSVDAVVGGRLATSTSAKLAITVFSWVEAAIFLVAVGVVLLILARRDRRAFHLPGGDGLVVTAAGAWATFLIFYRFLDKPSGGGSGQLQVEYGLSWGIFFGLLAAVALGFTGLKLRTAGIVEPALPQDAAGAGHRPGAGERDADQLRQERRERRAGVPPPREPPDRRRRAAPEGAAGSRRSAETAAQALGYGPGPDEAPTHEVNASEAPTLFDEPPAFEAPEFRPPRRGS